VSQLDVDNFAEIDEAVKELENSLQRVWRAGADSVDRLADRRLLNRVTFGLRIARDGVARSLDALERSKQN
jgi:hypothetical protein